MDPMGYSQFLPGLIFIVHSTFPKLPESMVEMFQSDVAMADGDGNFMLSVVVSRNPLKHLSGWWVQPIPKRLVKLGIFPK